MKINFCKIGIHKWKYYIFPVVHVKYRRCSKCNKTEQSLLERPMFFDWEIVKSE